MSGHSTVPPYARCEAHPHCVTGTSCRTGKPIHMRHPSQLNRLLFNYILELHRYHPNGPKLFREAGMVQGALVRSLRPEGKGLR